MNYVNDTDLNAERAKVLYIEHNQRIHARADRIFAGLLLAQWLFAVFASLLISPRTWAGAQSAVHIHFLSAMILGGGISLLPVLFAWLRPGYAMTRHTVAIGQMLMGALLIHLTGGRIETHFHVFGSLAFLAVYRDWKVLLTGTVVVAADHILRGVFFPQSIYGVMGGAEWRWIEHASWVVFEDIFLVGSCLQAQNEMRTIAQRHAELEGASQLREHADQLQKLATKNELLAQQANAATKAKSEFLATMSHELRTPMNAIINYADLAIRRAARSIMLAEDPAPLQQQHRFASEIRTAGERLLVLINQLLDLSRIEAGKMEVHVEEAPASSIAERVCAIAQPLMEANQNQFEVQCDSDIRFHTDVQKLEQCIINLVGNAAKFTHRGQVTLQMMQGATPGTAVIAVTDTGIGMTHEQMERLFVPFHQADSSITRQYGGSGLGLAITSSMIKLLGGTIAVESEQFKGTRFVITLPCTFREGESSATPPTHPTTNVDHRVAAGMGRSA